MARNLKLLKGREFKIFMERMPAQMAEYACTINEVTIFVTASSEEHAKEYFNECYYNQERKEVSVPNESEYVTFSRVTTSCDSTKELNADVSKENSAPSRSTGTIESTNTGSMNCSSSTTCVKWSDQATLCLIKLITEHRKDFKSRLMKQKTIWNKISGEMNENTYMYSAYHCENRFKSLKRTYAEYIVKCKKSGEGKASIKFEDELANLFNDAADIKPKFTISVGGGKNDDSQVEINDGGEVGVNVPSISKPSCSSSPSLSRKRAKIEESPGRESLRKSIKKESRPIEKKIMEYLDDAKTERQEMRAELRRQHAERMDKYDQFLDLLRKSIK